MRINNLLRIRVQVYKHAEYKFSGSYCVSLWSCNDSKGRIAGLGGGFFSTNRANLQGSLSSGENVFNVQQYSSKYVLAIAVLARQKIFSEICLTCGSGEMRVAHAVRIGVLAQIHFENELARLHVIVLGSCVDVRCAERELFKVTELSCGISMLKSSKESLPF